MLVTSFLSRMKEWIAQNQGNLLLFVGILVVGVLAFESGYLRGKMVQSNPVTLSIPALNEAVSPSIANTIIKTDVVISNTETQKTTASCPLVGSKNSNKYHLVTCAVAKRIKPENRVCFSSKEDAEKRGYVAGCVK